MQRSGYIPTLDGWRAVAIALVLAFHSADGLLSSPSPALRLFARASTHANFGVDIFFCLSGYLIGTLLLREKAKDPEGILGRFYVRRACRILPPLVGYLVAVAALGGSGVLPSVTWSEIAASLGFLRNYAGGSVYTRHFWSLAVEEHFYLLAPLILLALPPRRALTLAVALSLASSTWRTVESHHLWVSALLPDTSWLFRTEDRLDGLMNGLILALLLDHAPTRARLAERLTTPRVAALGLAALGAIFLIHDKSGRRTIFTTAFPLILAYTVLRPGTLAGWLLELAPLRWVGRISYSLYLWQQLFLPESIERASGALGRVQLSAWSVPLALALAWASHHLVELPMIRLGRDLAGRREALPSLAERVAPAGD